MSRRRAATVTAAPTSANVVPSTTRRPIRSAPVRGSGPDPWRAPAPAVPLGGALLGEIPPGVLEVVELPPEVGVVELVLATGSVVDVVDGPGPGVGVVDGSGVA
ncbi:MAG: hypothetical protein KA758_06185, partial [Acidimicrobiales bacterium]|nr:hypothetical protein [Acidimicrobiales bacterium]